MRFNSSAEGARLAFFITERRTSLCGTRWMTLVPTPPFSSVRKYAVTSTGPAPQFPVTTVVTP